MGATQSTQAPGVETSNNIIMANSQPSSIELPKYFAIWRHNQPRENDNWNACLIETEKVIENHTNRKIWKFKMISNPLEFQNYMLESAILVHEPNDRWFGGEKHKILVQRSSENFLDNNLIQETEILFNKAIIQLSQTYVSYLRSVTEIPVFKVKNKNRVMPKLFHHLETTASAYAFKMMFGMEFVNINQQGVRQTPRVDNELDILRGREAILRRREAMRFAERSAETFLQTFRPPVANVNTEFQRVLELNRNQVTREAPPSNTTIPQHIVNTYIEGLVEKGESCPISMLVLEKQTTCITPCGHAMLLHSAERWIQDAHSCPVCRLPVSLNQLQVWKL
jgi:hypothetical protein